MRNTIGLLYHPGITISGIKYIGKETNLLDEREAGLGFPGMGILELEPDEWENILLPLIKGIPTHELAEKIGLSPRQVIRLKQGKNHPRKETIGKIRIVLKSLNLLENESMNYDEDNRS